MWATIGAVASAVPEMIAAARCPADAVADHVGPVRDEATAQARTPGYP